MPRNPLPILALIPGLWLKIANVDMRFQGDNIVVKGETVDGVTVVPIRCLVMNLNTTYGKVEIERLLVNTTDTKIIGRGFVDFGAERIDLELDPRAKDFGLCK